MKDTVLSGGLSKRHRKRCRTRQAGAGKRIAGRLAGRAGFGLNEVIGIAAGIIIAVVVVIPGLQGFAQELIDSLANWWADMAGSLFAGP